MEHTLVLTAVNLCTKFEVPIASHVPKIWGGPWNLKKNGQRDPDRGIFGLFAFSLVTAFACRKIVDSYSFSRFRDINDKGQIPLRYPGRRSGRRCVHVVCVSQAGRNLVESQLRTGLRPDSSYLDKLSRSWSARPGLTVDSVAEFGTPKSRELVADPHEFVGSQVCDQLRNWSASWIA